MTRSTSKHDFAARPGTPDKWVKGVKRPTERSTEAIAYTARLTIDITPELRGRIKIEAFRRGVTVADMLRELLAREFSEHDGEAQ